MTSTDQTLTNTLVVTDTSVLINFIHIRQLDLLGRLDGHEFVKIEPGEAACIAIAHMRGQSVATDEKRDAERIALEMLGKHRLLRTEGVLKRCITAGLITLAEADAFKATLAMKRYVMDFGSFADLEAAW